MKPRIVTAVGIFVLFSIVLLALFFNNSITEKERIKSIEIDQIKFYMSKKRVEEIHGKGADQTPMCFGCELNFIYPELKLSGRYSDTLDRVDKKGIINHTKSPKVKQITTADGKVSIEGVNVGDSFNKAIKELESRGYELQINQNDNFYNYYFKNNLYIRLWTDENINLIGKDRTKIGQNEDIVKSITIIHGSELTYE
ncbi:hypothetical protein EBB07_31170 [Paenibacillaceae bacterium]|nr:hypothetical protein EBB07_31170 [Paenibacillaceae bacterium]